MRATSTPAPGHLREYVHNSALNVKGFERWKKKSQMVMFQLLHVVFRVVSRLAQDMAADKERELSSLAREDAGAMDIVNSMDSKLCLMFEGTK